MNPLKILDSARVFSAHPLMFKKRTLQGQPCSLERWKFEIIRIVGQYPDSDVPVAEIMAQLGPEWTTAESRPALSNALTSLRKAGSLKQGERHGTWRLAAPDAHSVQPTRYLRFVDDLCETLRRLGGYATAREIVTDFGLERLMELPMDMIGVVTAQTQKERQGNRLKTSEYQQFLLYLKRAVADRFIVQPFGDQAYSLPQDQLALCPLRGYWLHRTIRHAYTGYFDPDDTGDSLLANGPNAADQLWRREQARQFAQIGKTFHELYQYGEIADEAHDLMHNSLLLDLAQKWAKAAGLSSWDYYPEEMAALKKARWARRHRINNALYNAKRAAVFDIDLSKVTREQKLGLLLTRFWEGSINVHLAAPYAFYTEYAALYGVDAPRLSLGLIQHHIPSEQTANAKRILRQMRPELKTQPRRLPHTSEGRAMLAPIFPEPVLDEDIASDNLLREFLDQFAWESNGIDDEDRDTGEIGALYGVEAVVPPAAEVDPLDLLAAEAAGMDLE